MAAIQFPELHAGTKIGIVAPLELQETLPEIVDHWVVDIGIRTYTVLPDSLVWVYLENAGEDQIRLTTYLKSGKSFWNLYPIAVDSMEVEEVEE